MSSNPDGGELVPSCNTVAFGTAPPSRLQLSQRRRPNHLAGKTGTLSLNPSVDLVAMINGSDGLLVNIFRFLQPVEVVSFAIAASESVNKVVINEVKKSLDELYIDDIISIFGFIPPKILGSTHDKLSMIIRVNDYADRFRRLSNNELANIFSFLHRDEVMLFRQVCKKWNEAVCTLLTGYFLVDGPEKYMAMIATLRVLPNLERASLEYLGRGVCTPLHDEEEWLMMTSSQDHDFLRGRLYSLTISDMFHSVSSDYSVSFDYPHLEKLVISNCPYLEWNLMMLVGLPSLKELICIDNSSLSGNISSLRVLKGTLERVDIDKCENVEGNFMVLADFPRLRELNLPGTAVSGDIRDINENDFLDLAELRKKFMEVMVTCFRPFLLCMISFRDSTQGSFGYSQLVPTITKTMYVIFGEILLIGILVKIAIYSPSRSSWFGQDQDWGGD